MKMMRIVALENSPSIRAILDLTFHDPEFTLFYANDTRELAEGAAGFRPDVVLCSSSFMEEDKHEVQAFFEVLENIREVPVILLLRAFDPVREEAWDEMNFAGIIREPFDPNKIRELLFSLVNVGSIPQTLPEEPESRDFMPSEQKEAIVREVLQAVRDEMKEKEKVLAEKLKKNILEVLKKEG